MSYTGDHLHSDRYSSLYMGDLEGSVFFGSFDTPLVLGVCSLVELLSPDALALHMLGFGRGGQAVALQV